ncbi:dicer [Schizosaccharomyces osmophilus]|uniref:Dicer n=1 Tax=Schizosaccharomyces osmophilus TaxID=2545709 RepID=A0AAE9WFL6_9SCHI|nr:dicer [Schizosaccharomyces osmophilus]WBW75285.1 dicer [Schizosaccharomyces osmophilus]
MKELKSLQVLREYQRDILHTAKKQNTLLVMATGAGKTLLAVKLIKEKQEKQLLEGAQHQKRLSVFLVNTVPLVIQQADYLKSQLPFRIGAFYGEISLEMCEELFHSIVLNYEIIVITADLFYLCLARGFLLIFDFDILVFDECHHAIKNHAYARILIDFYHVAKAATTLEKQLPTIFGMTASPYTGKARNPLKRIFEWEELFNAKAYVVSNHRLSQHIPMTKEFVVPYKNLLIDASKNPIINKCETVFSGCKYVMRSCKAAQCEIIELGVWFGEQVWQFLVEELLRKQSRKSFDGKLSIEDNVCIKSFITEVEKWSQQQLTLFSGFRAPKLDGNDTSNKVLTLLEFLENFYRDNDTYRTMIFVERKVTAYSLTRFLRKLKKDTGRLRNIRPFPFVGHGDSDVTALSMHFREQRKNIHNFKQGVYNILIATSIAEEGIDIPTCNLVIRFNTCQSVTQYVQSKGRARAEDSKFMLLVNDIEQAQYQKLQDEERILTTALESLESTRELTSHVLGDNITTQNDIVKYEIDETGALLIEFLAVGLLYQYCNTLPSDSVTFHYPIFTCISAGQSFIYTVHLPIICNMPTIQGSPSANRKKAKRSAAFLMCVELINRGLINKHLQPLDYRNKLADMEERDEKALRDIEHDEAFERKIPQCWLNDAEQFFACKLFPVCKGKIFQPLLFVQSQRIPEFNFIRLRSNFDEVIIKSEVLETPYIMDDELKSDLQYSTKRLLELGLSSLLKVTDSNRSYWIAPLNTKCSNNLILNDLIDWSAVRSLSSKVQVVKDITMLKPHLLLMYDQESIFELYSFESLARQDMQGCSIVCKRMPFKLNYSLNKKQSMQIKKPSTSLRLNQVYLTGLSKYLKESALLLPSILYHMEALFLASEFASKHGLKCSLLTMLQALSTEDASMDDNYDRLEFLGDSFLKVYASSTVFLKYTHDQEYQLHVHRKQIISNYNLYMHAKKMEISRFALSEPMVIRKWCPFGFLRENKHGKNYPSFQLLSKKRLADLVESTIGACILDNGVDSGLEYCTNLGLGLLDVKNWSDWNNFLDIDFYASLISCKVFPYHEHIEDVTGYTFKNKAILHLAFIHPTMLSSGEVSGSYQQLEFLGDAVLEYLVVQYLFHKYPESSTGELTNFKSFFVCNHSLAYVAFLLGLHKYLEYDNSEMFGLIYEYQEMIEEAKSNKVPYFWLEVDPPKFIADTFESLICAIYLDSKFSFESLRFVLPLLVDVLGDPLDLHKKNLVLAKVHKLLSAQGCSDYKVAHKEELEIREDENFKLKRESYIYHTVSFIRHDNVVCLGTSRKLSSAKISMKNKLKGLLDKNSNLLLYSCDCAFKATDCVKTESGSPEG